MQQVNFNPSISSISNFPFDAFLQSSSADPLQMLDAARRVNQVFPLPELYSRLKKDLEKSFSGLTEKEFVKNNLEKLLKKLDDDTFANTVADEQFLNFASALIINGGLIPALVDRTWHGEHFDRMQKLKSKCLAASEKTEKILILYKLIHEYSNGDEVSLGLKFLCAIKLVLIEPNKKNVNFLIGVLLEVKTESDYPLDLDYINNLCENVLEDDPENLSINFVLLKKLLSGGEFKKAITLCETKTCFSKKRLIEIYNICDLDVSSIEKAIKLCSEVPLQDQDEEFRYLKYGLKIKLAILNKDYKKAQQLMYHNLKNHHFLYDLYTVQILIGMGRAHVAYNDQHLALKPSTKLTDQKRLILFLTAEAVGKYDEAKTLWEVPTRLTLSNSFYTNIAQCRLLASDKKFIFEHKNFLLGNLNSILTIMPEYIPALILLGKVYCRLYEELPSQESSISFDELFDRIKFGLNDNLLLQTLAFQCSAILKDKDKIKFYWGKIYNNLRKQDLKKINCDELLDLISPILESYQLKDELLFLYKKALDFKFTKEAFKKYFDLVLEMEDVQKCCDELELIVNNYPVDDNVKYYDLLAYNYAKINKSRKVIYFTSLSLKSQKNLNHLKLRATAYVETKQYIKAYADVINILQEDPIFPNYPTLNFYLDIYNLTAHFDAALELCEIVETKSGKETADILRSKVNKSKSDYILLEKPEAIKEIDEIEIVEEPFEEIQNPKKIDLLGIPLPIETPSEKINIPEIDEFQKYIDLKRKEEAKYLKEIYTKESYTKDRDFILPLPVNYKFSLQRYQDSVVQVRPIISYEASPKVIKITAKPIRLPVVVNHVMDEKLHQKPVNIIQKSKENKIVRSTFENDSVKIVKIPLLGDLGKDRLELCVQRLISLGDILKRATTDYNLKDSFARFVVSHALMYNIMKICEALNTTSEFYKNNSEISEFTKYVNIFLIETQYIHDLRNDIRNNFSSHSVETLIEIASSLHNSTLLTNIRKWLKFNNPNVQEGKKRKAQFLPKVPLKDYHSKVYAFDLLECCSFELIKLENIREKFKKDVEKEGDYLQAVKMSAAIIWKCLKNIPNIQFYLTPEELSLFRNAGNAFAHFIAEETYAGEVEEIKLGIVLTLLQKANKINEKLKSIKKVIQ